MKDMNKKIYITPAFSTILMDIESIMELSKTEIISAPKDVNNPTNEPEVGGEIKESGGFAKQSWNSWDDDED